eukprot:534749_1
MLLLGDGAAGVGVEAGVADVVDVGVGLKELGDLEGVGGLLLDAEAEGPHGLELVEGDLGGHDVAEDVLGEADGLVVLLGLDGDGAADGHVVAVVELGGGGEDDVGAEVEGLHDVGGHVGVVADVDEVLGLGEGGEGSQVDHGGVGVGGGLGEHQLGVGLDGGLDVLEVGEVNEVEGHAHAGEEDAAGTVGTTVGAVGDDGVVTGAHEGGEDGGAGGHAGAEGGGAVGTLEGGDTVIKGLDGGVGAAGVGVALGAVLGDGLLDEGGRLVDGGQDGAGDGV